MKESTKKATTAKRSEDLEVKDAAKVTGGSMTLNYAKIEYRN